MNPRAKGIDPVTSRILHRIIAEAKVAEDEKHAELTPRMLALGITGMVQFEGFAVICFGSHAIRAQISSGFAAYLAHYTDELVR